jgi:hypothetical protein
MFNRQTKQMLLLIDLKSVKLQLINEKFVAFDSWTYLRSNTYPITLRAYLINTSSL